MFSTNTQAVTIANDSFIYRQAKIATNLHYHFVFNTQTDRISGEWRERFHKFIARCVDIAGGQVVTVGGTNQTVKIRVRLPSTHSPDEFARRLKILSKNWARHKARCPNFAWREDYEAITLDSRRS